MYSHDYDTRLLGVWAMKGVILGHVVSLLSGAGWREWGARAGQRAVVGSLIAGTG